MATASAIPVRSRHVDDEPEALAWMLEKGSSPDDPCPKVVEMTMDDIITQLQKVRESEGFESDAYLLRTSDSFLGPRLLGSRHFIGLKAHCDLAIGCYNVEYKTKLELVNVVQANKQTVYLELEGMFQEFYITLKALALESGEESLYQAKVLQPFSYPGSGNLKLLLCRSKPSSS